MKNHPLIELAIREEYRLQYGSTLSVRQLREAIPAEWKWDKATFDKTMLMLAKLRIIDLHFHDYPWAMAPEDRELLVTDGTTYYVCFCLLFYQK